jgi:shikimate kinase
MNSLFSLDPLLWETSLEDQTVYQLGNAIGWLGRTGTKTAANHSLSGRLYLAKSGWLLLSVPNALVRGLFDALVAPGAELPLAGAMNVPNVDADLLNAHISVMTADEVQSVGADKINERGHNFGYTLGPLKEITVRGISGVSKVWAVQVSSPGLTAIRKSYGLSPLPKGHPFHITVAVRKKNVLGDNEVRKAAAADPSQVVLVSGHSGAGKSTLSKALAEKLKLPRVSVDQDPNFQKFLDDNTPDNHLPAGSPKEQDFRALMRQTAMQTLEKNDGPAVVEGVQLSYLPPEILSKYKRVHVNPPVEQAYEQRLSRTKQRYEKDPAKKWTPDVEQEKKRIADLVYKFHTPTIAAYDKLPGTLKYKPGQDLSALLQKLQSQQKQADLLSGGEADGKADNKFSKKELTRGTRHEHEHTDNDQIAKEIAKDHLSEDAAYYDKQEKIEKAAQPEILKDLLAAKEHSDNKRYDHKAAIIRRLMAQSPDDWVIDDAKPKYKGITHRPTNFRLHIDPTVIPAGVKAAANSVYLNELRNSVFGRGPFAYDMQKPVFENIRNHMAEIKRRGDWMLQAQRNNQSYQAFINPAYRHQLALQAFHGNMPQPSIVDQTIERFGGNFLGTPR